MDNTPSEVCCSYTYPVKDGAALTLKKEVLAWGISYIFIWRELTCLQVNVLLHFALRIWSVQKVCWWPHAMRGSTFSCPKPSTESRCWAGERCCAGLYMGNCWWCLWMGWMKNTEKNFLNPEGEQCPFLKTKTYLTVFLNTKLPFIVCFV